MKGGSFLIGLLLLALIGEAEAKKGYNVWAKEKIRYLNTKVAIEPHNAQLRVLLANAYYEDGDHYAAKKHLEKALELRPHFAEAHCNMAVILHAQGRLPEARHHYEEALRIDSTMVVAMAGLGTLFCRTERQAEGLELLEQVVELDPEQVGARFNMAVAYHKVGDFRKAIEHLEVLLQSDANYPGGRRALSRAYYSMGLLRLQAQQPDQALEFIDKALEHEHYSADMYFAKGLAHMDRHELGAAEKAFARVVALQDDHVPALHNLGAIYEQTGRPEKAIYCFERVRELAPHLSTIEAVKHATFHVDYLVE